MMFAWSMSTGHHAGVVFDRARAPGGGDHDIGHRASYPTGAVGVYSVSKRVSVVYM